MEQKKKKKALPIIITITVTLILLAMIFKDQIHAFWDELFAPAYCPVCEEVLNSPEGLGP